jgi:hypothetical protein
LKNRNVSASGSLRIEQSASNIGEWGVSTICDAKPGSRLTDDDVVVTHFDRQIGHLAAQSPIKPDKVVGKPAYRQPFPHQLVITGQTRKDPSTAVSAIFWLISRSQVLKAAASSVAWHRRWRKPLAGSLTNAVHFPWARPGQSVRALQERFPRMIFQNQPWGSSGAAELP